MTSFEMIKYHGRVYPGDVPLRIEEIAAHFDVQEIRSRLKISLHTEYSYGRRQFHSTRISKFPEIAAAQRDGIPQLWKNESWALQFADFIIELVGEKAPPSVIEIHPPFDDYTDVENFVKHCAVFEHKIRERFPDVELLIENRCGSVYHGGKFILSRIRDIYHLAERVAAGDLGLKMACDVPQIYTAHNAKTERQFVGLLNDIRAVRWFVGGVHLWGKRVSAGGRRVAHCGDLNSYFGDAAVKESFLRAFQECFDDGVARKMVLEVNSGDEDLASIVADLRGVGVVFV